MRKKLLTVGAVALVTVLFAGTAENLAAAEAESWQTIGRVWERGRAGEWPGPSVGSTTMRAPVSVRVLVYTPDARPKPTNIFWRVSCWEKGAKNQTMTTFMDELWGLDLPFELTLTGSQMPIVAPDFCEVVGHAWHYDSGRIDIKVKALYGSG